MGLQRFIGPQERYYKTALKELENGRKESCWMWFMFPQIKGLGYSPTAKYYEIQDFAEAKAYIKTNLFRSRMLSLCSVLLDLDTNDAVEIFGPIDSRKLQSSITLFYLATTSLRLQLQFKEVLDKFFDGELCEFTVNEIKRECDRERKHFLFR